MLFSGVCSTILWPNTALVSPHYTLHTVQLENNLNQRVLPSQGAGDVEADWTQLGIMSHSASSEFIIKMLLANSTFAKVSCNVRQYIHIVTQASSIHL